MHWCTEHLFSSASKTEKKKAHIYIHSDICIRIHMHKNTHAHPWHWSNTLKNGYWDSKIYAQTCIHIHIHMYIHACIYAYIYLCRYIHICMFINTRTHTHIRTHIQHVHMHTRKHAWNDSAAATARGADETPEAPHVSFVWHNQTHLAPPMLGLHCIHFLRHNTPQPPIPSSQYIPKQFADRGKRGFSVPHWSIQQSA